MEQEADDSEVKMRIGCPPSLLGFKKRLTSDSLEESVACYSEALKYAASQGVDFYRVPPLLFPLKREVTYEGLVGKAKENVHLLRNLADLFCLLDVRTEAHVTYFCHIDSDKPEIRDRSVLEMKCLILLMRQLRTFATVTLHLHSDQDTCTRVLLNEFSAEERNHIGIENNHDGVTWHADRVCDICSSTGCRPIYDICHDFLYNIRQGRTLSMRNTVDNLQKFFAVWDERKNSKGEWDRYRPFIHFGFPNLRNKGASHDGTVSAEMFWRIVNTLNAEAKCRAGKFDIMLETPAKEEDVKLLRGVSVNSRKPLSEELGLWA